VLGRHHHGTGSLLNTDHKPIRFTRGQTTAERGAGTTRRQIGGPDRGAIASARTGGRAAEAEIDQRLAATAAEYVEEEQAAAEEEAAEAAAAPD